MLKRLKDYYLDKRQRFREKVCAPVVFFVMDHAGFRRHLPYTHTGDDAQRLIFDRLTADAPCMIGRIGCTEIRSMECTLHRNSTWLQKLKWRLTMHQTGKSKKLLKAWVSADHPDDAFFESFTRMMMHDIEELDVFAAWRWEETEVFKAPYDFDVIGLGDLEPFFSKVPWTSALRGRKVLVVLPFVKTVEYQYQRRENLFEDPNILPEFDLQTYMPFFRGVRDDFELDWFGRLDRMKREISDLDFDIALIAAGSYGFPLAAHIKRLGRKSVMMGGVLQLLFGIRGARWDASKVYQKFYNEYWIRPGDEYKPKGFHKFDGGCYW